MSFLTTLWARHKEKAAAKMCLQDQAVIVMDAIEKRDVGQLSTALGLIIQAGVYEDYLSFEQNEDTFRKYFNSAMKAALETDDILLFETLLGAVNPNFRVFDWREYHAVLAGGSYRDYMPVLEKAILLGSRKIAKNLVSNPKVAIDHLCIFNGEPSKPRAIDLALRGMPEVKQLLFQRKAEQQLIEAKKLTEMANASLSLPMEPVG